MEFENQNDLRDLIDKLRDKLGTSVIVFANIYQEKTYFYSRSKQGFECKKN